MVPIGGILLKPPWKRFQDKLSLGVSYRGKMWGFYGTGPTGVDVLIKQPQANPIVIFSDPGGKTIDYIGFNDAVGGGCELGIPTPVSGSDEWKATNANTSANMFEYSVYALYKDSEKNEENVYRSDPQIENTGQ